MFMMEIDSDIPLVNPDLTRRRVNVSGHQEFWSGMFHQWGVDSEGKTVAIVETSHGDVKLEEPHKTRFVS